MKRLKLITIFVLSVTATALSARSHFGFFFGPQPCYIPAPVYVPAPVVPSLGFSMGIPLGDPCDGAPTLGFSVDVPLVDPYPRPAVVHRVVQPVYVENVCFDNNDKRYWRIYNHTDRTIWVMSKSETKQIRPGDSRKLDHSTSFSLRITDGDQKIKVRTTLHTLSIRLNADDDLKVHQG